MRIFDKKGKLVTPVSDQGDEILVLETFTEQMPTAGIYVKHPDNFVELLVPLNAESVAYIKANGGIETSKISKTPAEASEESFSAEASEESSPTVKSKKKKTPAEASEESSSAV